MAAGGGWRGADPALQPSRHVAAIADNVDDAFDIESPRQIFEGAAVTCSALVTTDKKTTNLLVTEVRQGFDQNTLAFPFREPSR